MIGSQVFVDLVQESLNIGDRFIRFNNVCKLVHPHRYDNVFINFVNLPSNDVNTANGAEAENNRMSFEISGFDEYNPTLNDPSIVGKVKIEMRTNSIGRQYNLRGKTATPEKIAEYLTNFLNEIAAKVPPKRF